PSYGGRIRGDGRAPGAGFWISVARAGITEVSAGRPQNLGRQSGPLTTGSIWARSLGDMMDEGKPAILRQIGKLMPWKCRCNANNEGYAAFCSTCCRPNECAVVPPSAATPTQPAKASTGIAAWQLMAVAGVLILGMVFGLSFAVTAFSTGEA